MQRVAFIPFLLFFSPSLSAQVSNNTIHERLLLVTEAAPLQSNTNQSTVEWSCVNKALTNKCLVYHNDQWFTFIPTDNGRYFLNLSSQQCRDKRGVQVVVIEGNPCEVATYRIKQCISKISQDNVFIVLDSLKAGTSYLINIDGFLGDFCEFEIQVSAKPQGLPRFNQLADTITSGIAQENELVKLKWSGQAQLLEKLERFEIYRQTGREVKASLRATVGVESNALGRMREQYFYTDTLDQPGETVYKIVGVTKNETERMLLDVFTIKFFPPTPMPLLQSVYVPLSFAGKGTVEITVIDAFTDKVLNSYTVAYKTPQHHKVSLKGSMRYWIRVKNLQTRESRQFTYQVNEQNEAVLVR